MDIKGYDIISLVGCDHGHILVLNNNSSHYIVVETETEGADLDGEHFQMHINPEAHQVSSFSYAKGGDYSSSREAYRAAMQAASNLALLNTQDSE